MLYLHYLDSMIGIFPMNIANKYNYNYVTLVKNKYHINSAE